jgi:hypothetical protein
LNLSQWTIVTTSRTAAKNAAERTPIETVCQRDARAARVKKYAPAP